MNLIGKIIWKIVDILYSMFGFQFNGYVEEIKNSLRKKIYITIVFIVFLCIAINYTKNVQFLSGNAYIKFIFALVLIEEHIIVMISILIEMFIIFPRNDRVFQKIFLIDKLMNLDRHIKLKFVTKMTFCYTFYIFYVVFSTFMDMAAWGFSITTFLSVWKMKSFEMVLLKFIMIIHLHLCRLCLMNDHLRKKLNSKYDYEKKNLKNNWLLVWKLYPNDIIVRHYVEDLYIYMTIYSSLCENVAFINKKYKIFVSA